MIPYGHQSIDDDDIAAVVAVLKGDWLTQGPAVEQFEQDLAAAVGASYAVAFANGTAALHGAVAAAGLGSGDVVATSTLSFVASANCARYTGARPRLLDIDPVTLNIDPSSLPSGLDALVAVHFAGLPVDLALLGNRPRVVIEDAAHALGARTPSGPVGNCAHSDLCCFSFHPVKAITTGEGGAVTTNSPELVERLRRFRNHGIERRADIAPWYYDVKDLGYNYRLTDIQAALGSSQLAKLASFIARRNELADRYRRALADTNVQLPPSPPADVVHAYHLFPVRVRRRSEVFTGLLEAGVGPQVHYVPIHRHPAMFEAVGDQRFPAADAAYKSLLSLPLYPGLTDNEQNSVIDALRKLVS